MVQTNKKNANKKTISKKAAHKKVAPRKTAHKKNKLKTTNHKATVGRSTKKIALKKILIIGDPPDKLKLKSDTSLALAEAAIKKGYEIYWCEPQHIIFYNNELMLSGHYRFYDVSVEKINTDGFVDTRLPFSLFSFCLVRKDPPFDTDYLDLCWLLAAQRKVKIINPPISLLHFHEKSLHWHAVVEGALPLKNTIPTCLSSSIAVIESFCNEIIMPRKEKIILKPWLGHGGQGISLFENTTDLLNHLKVTGLSERMLVQPFQNQISKVGDMRILIANGKVIGNFVRIPKEGHVESNLAQGGHPEVRQLSKEQRQISLKLARFLKKKGILFAGLDMIGPLVGEINITSPTGIRTYEDLTGKNISLKALESFGI